jgi:hypothetical protein
VRARVIAPRRATQGHRATRRGLPANARRRARRVRRAAGRAARSSPAMLGPVVAARRPRAARPGVCAWTARPTPMVTSVPARRAGAPRRAIAR